MKHRWLALVVALACVAMVPRGASAQASITGVVKDASGAVLPGVTVEAASPVLIEKVRTVATDSGGQYRVVDLRPGTYSVTFTLPGFSVVKRDGVELTGSFTAVVNADLRIGAIEETLVVEATTPTVDVQSATRQQVMNAELVAELPTGRNFTTLGVLVPGVTQLGGQDVGGTVATAFLDLVSHGSHADGQRMLHNGVSLMALFGAGNRNTFVPNPIAYQEVTIDSGAVGADLGQGGVRVNLIPRDGGNSFNSSTFIGFATEDMQADNLTANLEQRGLRSVDKIYRSIDVNPGFGGPLLRDKVWFYAAGRYNTTQNYVPNIFYDSNATNPSTYVWAPDPNRPGIVKKTWKDGLGRATWQVNPKHKVSFTYEQQSDCPCPWMAATPVAIAPEAPINAGIWSPQRVYVGEWSSPMTNRILLEAVGVYQDMTGQPLTDYFTVTPGIAGAVDRAGRIPNLNYKAPSTFGNGRWGGLFYRAAVSYVTGSQALKIGFNDSRGFREENNFLDGLLPYSYVLTNGVPNSVVLYTYPTGRLETQETRNKLDHEGGLYAQHRYTFNRITTNAAVRYDFYSNHYPAQQFGPGPLAPNLNIAFPETDGLNWKDITPRLSTTIDVFGTGKTAVKVSLNKYLQGVALAGIALDGNPASSVTRSTPRAWTDVDGDFYPDCDLLNPLANNGGDQCGPNTIPAFGTSVVTTRVDEDLRTGWNKRGYDWEFGVGVQQEVLPRVSVDVGYFRRWFGNFLAIDNLAVSASDFDKFNITAPSNPALPNGGGYTVEGVYNLKPSAFGRTPDNLISLASDYGKQIEQWNGMDFSVNARLPEGTTLAAGVSTGRTLLDNCEVVEGRPEMLGLTSPGQAANRLGSFNETPGGATWLPLGYCRSETDFLTQVKMLGSYTVPRIDVRVSATYQSIPGPQRAANFDVTNAQAIPAIGRPITGTPPFVRVNVIEPGTVYGDRLNQVDLRFSKILRFGRTRHAIGLDIFNALNSDAVLTENASFASFTAQNGPTPTRAVMARFAKVSWQLDF